ncbi:hypothetical protein GTA08_BOTSDO00311 [Neofusicoccum parvum]|nr:hypothetical protein GTA08_BOTSDO00311 [Neofusicoccum parvum]
MLLLVAAVLLHLLPRITPALPVNPDSIDPSSEEASVLTCTDPDFAGTCTLHATPLGNNNCISLDGTATSIQPDNGLDCIFYSNGVCRTFLSPATESFALRYPGSSDLAKSGWTEQVLSYSCVGLNTTDYANVRVPAVGGPQS